MNTFSQLEKLVSHKDYIPAFKNELLPLYKSLSSSQKESLFNISCRYGKVSFAEFFMPYIPNFKTLVAKVLPELIVNYTVENTDILKFLLQHTKFDTTADYKNMLMFQPISTLDFVVEHLELSSLQTHYLIAYTIEKNYPEKLKWILDKQLEGRIPVEEDMLYYSFSKTFYVNRLLSPTIMDYIIQHYPKELSNIKSKMTQGEYKSITMPLNKISNNLDFCQYFKQHEIISLQKKIEANIARKEDKFVKKINKI